MSNEMKLQIVQASERLLNAKNKKKLTVTDIVEECHITRQTFYYHFKDIPDMLIWDIQRHCEDLAQEISSKKNMEEIAEYCLTFMAEHRHYKEKIMASNYGEVTLNLVSSIVKKALLEAIERNDLFPNNTVGEKKLIVTYYVYAFGGVMKEWEEIGIEDTAQIAKILTQLIKGNINFGNTGKCIEDVFSEKDKEETRKTAEKEQEK